MSESDRTRRQDVIDLTKAAILFSLAVYIGYVGMTL